MNLKDHILDVQQGIKTGRFLNEASVSQGIVLNSCTWLTSCLSGFAAAAVAGKTIFGTTLA
jgi:hypothetical protein